MSIDERDVADRLADAAERRRCAERQFRAGEPKLAKDVIASVMSRRAYGRILANHRFDEVLREVVGEALADFVQVIGLRRGRPL